jgi:hypothetical protein
MKKGHWTEKEKKKKILKQENIDAGRDAKLTVVQPKGTVISSIGT